MVADESWYTNMPSKEMQKRVGDHIASRLTKNLKDDDGVKLCPLSLMIKAASSYARVVQVRPNSKELNVAPVVTASHGIMVEMPLLGAIHTCAITGNHNPRNYDANDFLGNIDAYKPMHAMLPTEFMQELRSTPGMTSHAKWLRGQLESKHKKYMASEFKQSLRLIIGKMMKHQLGDVVLNADLQNKFPLFHVQQVATTAEYYSCAITSGGLTEIRLCLIGEYIHAGVPLEKLPGIGLAGKRANVKATDEDQINGLIEILKQPECFMTHVTPGVLTVTPAGYFSITIGVKEAVSTMDHFPPGINYLQKVPQLVNYIISQT